MDAQTQQNANPPKQVNHHETKNLAHFGTLLTEGEATGLVVATGAG